MNRPFTGCRIEQPQSDAFEGSTIPHGEVPIQMAKAIEKRRHVVKAGKDCFEVDVFKGDHSGLIVAEIELSAERAPFKRPEWLGREVTGLKRYYNAHLAVA